MLNLAELGSRLRREFPDAAPVSDTAIRFTRKDENAAFAVYYIALTDELPSNKEALDRYQDEVVGRHYFEGSKSLQWSNYLYLVTTADQLRQEAGQRAKELIEADRTYARKFVVLEDEIDAALRPAIEAISSIDASINVFSIWSRRLSDAGLDSVIFGQLPYKERLRRVEARTSAPRAKSEAQRPRIEQSETLPFIEEFELRKYRPYPARSKFTFGTANLIVGPNAVGKTSLLEAIELYYCGRSKRSPASKLPYDLVARLSDGRADRASDKRKLQVFRDRNLGWYGRPEANTNLLYQSFALYNFLDTDAAVRLSDSTDNVEDDLSRLLVGPETSRVWHDMQRVRDGLAVRLRALAKQVSNAREKRDALRKIVDARVEAAPRSAALSRRLDQMLRRRRWKSSELTSDASASKLVANVSEFLSLVEQVIGLRGMKAPLTLSRMEKHADALHKTIRQARHRLLRLEQMKGVLQERKDALSKAEGQRRLLERIQGFFSSRVPALIAEERTVKTRIADLSRLIAGTDEISNKIGIFPLGTRFSESVSRLGELKEESQEKLRSATEEYDRFKRLQRATETLVEQLRALAAEVLHGSPQPDVCPLCHTQFSPGELSEHIYAHADPALGTASAALLDRQNEAQEAVRHISESERSHDRLLAFLEKANLSEDVRIEDALVEIMNRQNELTSARARLGVISDELQELENSKLGRSEYERLLAEARAAGVSKDAFDGDGAVEKEVIKARRSVRRSQMNLKSIQTACSDLGKTLQEALGCSSAELGELDGSLVGHQETFSILKSLISKLDKVREQYPWPVSADLSKLSTFLKSLRSLAYELKEQLAEEQKRSEAEREAAAKLEDVAEELARSEPGLERVRNAHKTLDDLIVRHSLPEAMADALARHKSSIEAIFRRIHSPPEFSGLGPKIESLIRASNGAAATLSEISTGQRAAFALSIFLAHNLQLKAGPPVLLIDDPIAHVDDLNSLSFLDYLRELLLKGRRQIFFATASTKVAALFERKFDFLGDVRFKRIELGR
jgi:DNA repair exonuclease SbcCD ATPase subunit